MGTQRNGNMAGRLLFIILAICGCAHSPNLREKVILPVPIQVSKPTVYQNVPKAESLRLLPRSSAFEALALNGNLINKIQVFLRPSRGIGTTVIHLVMPYQASLQPPETNLLAKHFLVGDTNLPEVKLLERWQNLGNQIQVFSRDNQVIFRTRIRTQDLGNQIALLTSLLSERDLEPVSLQRQWRRQRVLFAANNRTAWDLAKPFYRHITWQNTSPVIRFSTDPDKLKTEFSTMTDKAFCLSGFRLFLESDMPAYDLGVLLEQTLGQLAPRGWNCNQPQKKEKTIHPRRIYLLDKKGSQQVEILLGMPTVARNHRDWDALTTLADILGTGSGGRLFQDLRERQGLTYGVYAQHKVRDGNSDLFVQMKTRPEKIAASLKGIQAHIQKLIEEPVFPAEIRIARAARQGTLIQQLDTAYGRLALNAYAYRFNLSLDQLLSPGDPLSPTDLQQVAARYFSNPWQIILVGDDKQISGQLNHWFPDFAVVRIPAKKAMKFKP